MNVNEAIRIIKQAANDYAVYLEDIDDDSNVEELDRINEAFQTYDSYSIVKDSRNA